MSEKKTARRWFVDRASLPASYPTHAHSPQFWEQLGRTVATFGFLEEVLERAVLVFTGAREYPLHALTDTLRPLADCYGEAVRQKQDSTIKNVDELVESIRKAAEIRNVLCHASWGAPDNQGKSLLWFIRNKRDPEIFETRIDIPFLRQVQDHVRDLACDVMDTVTQMGYQFPGGAGPGEAT